MAAPRPTSFALHIKPLFRDADRKHMLSFFDLHKYEDVKSNAAGILDRVARDTDDPELMPPEGDGGPWPPEWIALFKRWISEKHPR